MTITRLKMTTPEPGVGWLVVVGLVIWGVAGVVSLWAKGKGKGRD